MNIKRIAFTCLVLTLLAACGTTPAGNEVPSATPQQPSPVPPSPTPVPPIPTDTPAPTLTPAPKFPPEPQKVEFQAEDGANLVGYYYPAAVDPAPVVVLMHWVGGSNCEWLGVNLVQWLQNRGLPEGVAGNAACANAQIEFALPLAEYPPLPAGKSYAVFAFNYRGHGEGASMKFDPAGWLKDSIAAVKKAQTLEGVDPQRSATIGADGAIDGCGEGCLGALSLSPGNYLGVPYAEAVKTLETENKSAWCVASKSDRESFPACESASGDNYQKFIYEKGGHGMSFFGEGFDPLVQKIIFDFTQAVFDK